MCRRVGAGVLTGAAAVAALESAKVQKEMASAIWSMAIDNTENQVAIAEAGGIKPLIQLLDGHSRAESGKELCISYSTVWS